MTRETLITENQELRRMNADLMELLRRYSQNPSAADLHALDIIAASRIRKCERVKGAAS